MRARGLLLPALLALAGALAVGWGRGAFEGGAGSDARVGPEGLPPRVADPVLGGIGDARARPPALGQVAQDAEVDPLPADLPRWGFHVRVLTGEPREAGLPVSGARVHLALVGTEGALKEWEGRTSEDGVCRLGPIALPAVPRHLLGSLVLQSEAEHPAHGESWRSGRGLRDLAQGIREASDEGGVRWVTTTAKLWAIHRVRGRLLTSTGHPVDGIWIDLEPRTRGFGSARTDRDGAFEVRPSREAGVQHHLEAECGGAFEIRHRVALGDPADGAMREVRLPGGDEAAGRITDREGKPLAGIHLVLAQPWWDPNAGFTVSRGGYTPPRWISRLSTRSADDGTFAFAGLKEREPYVLWWPGDGDTWQRLPEETYRGDLDLAVVLTRHRFRILLVDALTGAPVQGQTRIRLLGADGEPVYPELRAFGSTPEEEGRIAAPGERFRLHAWARGYAVAVETFTMPEDPGSHEVAIPLPPLTPGSLVRVRFVDQAGRALGRVPVVLTREVEGLWGDLDLKLPFGEEGDGWLRLRDAPPGPLHLETKDKLGHPPNGRWRFALPLAIDLEVPETGVWEKEIVCPQGGSVRLHLLAPSDPADRPMGELELLHESGVSESPWWYAPEGERDGEGGWDFQIIGDGRFEPDGRVFESCAVLPGAWTLGIEESEHWQAVSLPLRVAAGEITDVRVTLEPRD